MHLIETVSHWTASLADDAPSDFSPTVWLGRWLRTPNPALAGERPLTLLDTADGRALVAQVLGSMESGAYW
jgi:hypothetical protein